VPNLLSIKAWAIYIKVYEFPFGDAAQAHADVASHKVAVFPKEADNMVLVVEELDGFPIRIFPLALFGLILVEGDLAAPTIDAIILVFPSADRTFHSSPPNLLAQFARQ
jgi:hypothetical protein